jgi:hypothetical protein
MKREKSIFGQNENHDILSHSIPQMHQQQRQRQRRRRKVDQIQTYADELHATQNFNY